MAERESLESDISYSTSTSTTTTSTNTSTSTERRLPPNFSRPQPHPHQSALPSRSKSYQQPPPRVHVIEAFHDPTRDAPTQRRRSFDLERTDSTTSSDTSDFASDHHSADSDLRTKSSTSQRYTATDFVNQGVRFRLTPSQSSTDTTTPSSSSNPARQTDTHPPPQILKRVSMDQRSERIPYAPRHGGDGGSSHHTSSESGTHDSGSFGAEGNWQSSDADTSSLSAAEIRKLERKGVNPALYVEMRDAKEARGKGKKWVPSLLGNGFLN